MTESRMNQGLGFGEITGVRGFRRLYGGLGWVGDRVADELVDDVARVHVDNDLLCGPSVLVVFGAAPSPT